MENIAKKEDKNTTAFCEDCRDYVIIRAGRVFEVNKRDPYAPIASHGFRCPRCDHVNYTLTYGNLHELGIG